MTLSTPSTKQEFESALKEKSSSPVIISFWASWHPPSLQIVEVLKELCNEYKTLSFFSVDAEKLESIAENYNVQSVPYTIVVKEGKVLEALEGAFPTKLVDLARKYSSSVSTSSTGVDKKASTSVDKQASGSSTKRKSPEAGDIKKLIISHPVLLALIPSQSTSQQAVEFLKNLKIIFNELDVSSNSDLQKGINEFSGHTEYPQLFVQGKYIGDYEALRALDQKKALLPLIPVTNQKQDLETRLRSLIAQEKVMIFMKGSPTQPQCGFSRKAVEILEKTKVKFGSFDILSDQQVREGLKKLSNWPTYPQLYVNGDLIGGIDIMSEMVENGELQTALEATK